MLGLTFNGWDVVAPSGEPLGKLRPVGRGAADRRVPVAHQVPHHVALRPHERFNLHGKGEGVLLGGFS